MTIVPTIEKPILLKHHHVKLNIASAEIYFINILLVLSTNFLKQNMLSTPIKYSLIHIPPSVCNCNWCYVHYTTSVTCVTDIVLWLNV